MLKYIHKLIWGINISAYLDDSLSGRERIRLERHLESCKYCREYLNQLKAISVMLETMPEEDISPDMDINIRKRLELTLSSGGPKMISLRKKILTPIAAVMIVIMMGMFSLQVYYRRAVKGNIRSRADSIGEQFFMNRGINARIKSSYDTYTGAGVGVEMYIPIGEDQSNAEDYAAIEENGFKAVSSDPLSTLSIDVDTASYSNVRRFINNGQLPPADAVRIEEMINYFDYDYPEPKGKEPFSITTEASSCPWNKDHNLVLLGLQGKRFEKSQLPASNLVFLIDVSGSMDSPNKLPLLKDAFKLMVSKLGHKDKVSIVVYAGAAGVVLDSVQGTNKKAINRALRRLSAGGSTAGGAGIEKAYALAKKNFIEGGNNRVILASDGDFNVGASSNSAMQRLIEEKREDGIFLSCVGFGMGNYKDSMMEILANKGNGNYAYIDNINEARKFFVNDLQANLFTIAKDVKIQVEFNPAAVKAYRLIGYENRLLNKEDFNDDTKDAGELGAGHNVTALYEIIPADSDEFMPGVDELKYQKLELKKSDDVLTVKLRYKKPQASKSQLIEQNVTIDDYDSTGNNNLNWASAVAELGMLLRKSKYRANANYAALIERARKNIGEDDFAYRQEFVELANSAYISFGQPAYEYETYRNETSQEKPKEIEGYNPWK